MSKLIDALQLTQCTHSIKGVLEKRTVILHSTTKHLKRLIIALLWRCYFNVKIRNSTLTHKYETHIIIARAGRVATLILLIYY